MPAQESIQWLLINESNSVQRPAAGGSSMLCGACLAPPTRWGEGSENPVAVFEDGSLSEETGLRQERERRSE